MPIFDKDLIVNTYNKKISKGKLIDFINNINQEKFNIRIKIDFKTNNNDIEFNFISKDYKKLHDFVYGD